MADSPLIKVSKKPDRQQRLFRINRHSKFIHISPLNIGQPDIILTSHAALD